MRKKLSILLLFLFLTLAVLIIYFFTDKAFAGSAGLLVETNPPSTVYINDIEVGKTPIDTTLIDKEINLRLVPESLDTPLTVYETRVNLTAGVRTVVLRNFAESDEASTGSIISFEKSPGAKAIAVISYPRSAQIFLNGTSKGFSPIKTADVTEGEYTLKTVLPGYIDKEIKVTPKNGYILTVILDLARDVR